MSRAILALVLTAALGGVAIAQPPPPPPPPPLPTPAPPTHNLWVGVETPSIPGDFRWEYKGSYPSEQLARDAVSTHCPGCPETTTRRKPNMRTYIVLGIKECPDNSGELGMNCASTIPVSVPGGDPKTVAPVCLPCPPTPCVPVCQPVCAPACERPRLFPLFRRCR